VGGPKPDRRYCSGAVDRMMARKHGYARTAARYLRLRLQKSLPRAQVGLSCIPTLAGSAGGDLWWPSSNVEDSDRVRLRYKSGSVSRARLHQ
jgi:hypothetical protein